MGRLGCLLEAPGPPREARPPMAPQRHSKEAVWVVWGCLLEISGPHLGGLPAPKGTPKSLQGRGQYEANDPKLKQTKASTLELHNSLPQGLWSSTQCSRTGFLQSSANVHEIALELLQIYTDIYIYIYIGRNVGSRPITPGCKGTVAAEAKPV